MDSLLDRMQKADAAKLGLLRSTLSVAVPMWIERLRSLGWDLVLERAKVCSQVIAEKGDVIMFRGGKKGETAYAFNHLAEGIACLAFAPGGVHVFGDHYDAKMKTPRCPRKLIEMRDKVKRKPRRL